LDPFQFVVIAIAGWMNQPQKQVVEYPLEENRVLGEQDQGIDLATRPHKPSIYHLTRVHDGITAQARLILDEEWENVKNLR
jgi:hypothetical protein